MVTVSSRPGRRNLGEDAASDPPSAPTRERLAVVGRRGSRPGASRARPARSSCAFEHDLERGQALVAVVLGFMAQAAGLLVGVVEDALGDLLGLAHDLGALRPSARPAPGRLQKMSASRLRLRP